MGTLARITEETASSRKSSGLSTISGRTYGSKRGTGLMGMLPVPFNYEVYLQLRVFSTPACEY